MRKDGSASPAYMEIPRIYLGSFHGTKSSSVSLHEKIGKGVAISAAYLNWSSGFNTGSEHCSCITHPGRTPTWKRLALEGRSFVLGLKPSPLRVL
ncbi:MAG: hypothetical protein CVU41_16210 [Chloroflexi bacterium HGW-Chloroflexi-3]|nr:MAG: hypothetical protein CVU41_16210 [Chloroflexi bacterium HGW-Chloroflexi-3]